MAERYIPEHRRNNYKAKSTFKPDELRRRREEQQVEIRKQKREENLAKRRGIGARGDGAPGASLGAAPDSDDEGINTESQVSIRGVRVAELEKILTCVTAERGPAADGPGRFLRQDRRPDCCHHQIPQAALQGAQPAHRASHRDRRRQPLRRVPPLAAHARPVRGRMGPYQHRLWIRPADTGRDRGRSCAYLRRAIE